MKKIYLSMIAALALFASCDPLVDDVKWDGETVSQEQLQNGITIEQFDMDADGKYVAAEKGNYIKFSTSPSKVVDVFIKDADGVESVLHKAAANGMFELRPGRGSEESQTLYFRTKEFDGSSVEASKTIMVAVAQELQPGVGYLVSYAGQKTWKWAFDGATQVWGNFGNAATTGEDFANTGTGAWWGVTSGAEFAGQQQHRGGDTVKGDDQDDSYMIFYENGSVKSFDPDGNEVRSAKFQLVDYDPANRTDNQGQPWAIGQLVIQGDDGGILWPYAINTNGFKPQSYDIVKMTTTDLVLTYCKGEDGNTVGGWSEATFWRFKAEDAAGDISGYASTGNDWTWDWEMTAWGNCGYQAGDDWSASNQGQWWGVTSSAEFDGQVKHRGGDALTGDTEDGSYMTFFPDGTLKAFNTAGAEITNGKWSITKGVVNNQARTLLNTTEGTILWPYAINTDGFKPTQFELMHISADKMALVYAKDGTGAWVEATFWRFKKK